jgi:uncharacterized membrane protein HdeD (DUF308 family)
MATSHTTPTPPHPRSAGEESRPGEPLAGQARTEQGQAEQGHAEQGQAASRAQSGRHAEDGGTYTAFGIRAWQALVTAGVVTFILGLMVLIWPSATLVVLALLFGCYLVLAGVLSMIEGISDHNAEGAMRVAYIVLGVLGVVLGLFCLRRIDVTVLLLAFLLSAFWIMRGVLDIAAAMSNREVSGRGLRAFAGVLSLIAGVLVLFWPGITLTILLVFAGAWLLAYGIMIAFLGFGLRREIKRASY